MTDWHDEYRKRVEDIEAREEAAMDETRVLPGDSAVMKVGKLNDQTWDKQIRPLNEKEFEALKSSITKYGILDPILIYDSVIIDGHHRYRAAKELGLKEVPCCKVTFGKDGFSNDVIIRIILDKNAARRQLTPVEYDEILGKLYNLEKHDGAGRPKAESPDNRGEKLRKDDAIKSPKSKSTKEKIAKKTGVSPKKVERAGARVEFTEEHPEFANDPTANVLELKKADKEFRADFGDELAAKLYKEGKATAALKMYGGGRFKAKDAVTTMQLLRTGCCREINEALLAVFENKADGYLAHLDEEQLAPPEVETDSAEAEEKKGEDAPAEDSAAEKLSTVKVVLDGIAAAALAEGHDIQGFPFSELAQVYRTLFGEEMFSKELRDSLVA